MICKICKNEKFKSLKFKDNNRKLSNQNFTYILCMKCNSVFCNDNKLNLNFFYKNSFNPFDLKEDKFKKIQNKNHYFYNIFKKYSITGDFLEIGPGNGYFAKIMKDQNHQIDLIEQNKNLCDFYHKRLKFNVKNVHCLDINKFNTEKKYKAIFAWQVVEHITDIDYWLIQMHKLLDNNGYLFLSTPNSSSFQFKIFNKFWAHLDVPRHQTIYNNNSLKLKFNSKNFTHIASFWGLDTLLWNRFGWIQSLNNLFNKNNNFLSKVLGYLFFFIFFPLEMIPGLGTSFISVYKKNG